MSPSIRPQDTSALNPFAPPEHSASVPAATATAPAWQSWTPAPAAPKTPADYVRALRKRYWVVLATALLIVPSGMIYALRLPDLYQAIARIKIEPPRLDDRLLLFAKHGGLSVEGASQQSHYVADRIVQLKNPALAEQVASSPELNFSPAEVRQAVALLAGLTTRVQPGSNTFDLFLTGPDRAKVAVLLNRLIDRFSRDAYTESMQGINDSQTKARTQAEMLQKELNALKEQVAAKIKDSNLFGVGNRSLPEEQYVQLNSLLVAKRAQHDQLVTLAKRQRRQAAATAASGAAAGPAAGKIAGLQDQLDYIQGQLDRAGRSTPGYGSDPVTSRLRTQYRGIKSQLDELQSHSALPQSDWMAVEVAQSSRELEALEDEVDHQLDAVHDTMPQFLSYQSLLAELSQKKANLDAMQEKMNEFDYVVKSVSRPVTLLNPAEEPTEPSGPNRRMYMALSVFAGLGLGVLLVCALETIDRRIRVPEQLVAGVALPLLGVVPRMRRLAALYRGGHLWTAKLPNSVEADAFRNLRASLLGATGREGRPVVSLLVTSPKPSEGKTTTALNLAATFARCGERTLLIDADLRRSSLGAVFPPSEEIGLIDVLRDEVPWQRAVIRTEIPTLDVLPIGLVAGVPVEILGTLELAQLLKKLSGHYHRILIDGPAVLGMADCRMLGRVVDAAILVVRSGTQSLAPVQRTRAMLDQSRVPIAGVVFNGLDEDLENWGGLLTQLHPGHGAQLESRPSARAASPVAAIAP
jgi:capsular exopolysaccharide synthesis family protein